MDGYKTLLKKKWRRRFKKDGIKQVISPAECTDASTSVIDEHIGATFKKDFSKRIEKLMFDDEELFDKINDEGLGFMRSHFTYLSCDAFADTLKEMDIPAQFKACGLCNDIEGGERHLIKCGNLVSYEAPTKDYPHQKEPYSAEKINEFIQKEISATAAIKKKRFKKNNKKLF